MTGLIEEFCRSSRRNVAKTSREAFPYLLKLLNACRVILQQNVQKWDVFTREDPVYGLIEQVADILVQYSKPNVKFNMQDLLKTVKGIPTTISNFSESIEIEFNGLKSIEERKAQTLKHTTGRLERFLKKAGSVISSDETFHVEVVLYKEPCKTELTGPVSDCRPDNTVDLLLVDLLVQGHFRGAFSLQDNPHFFPHRDRARGRSDPLPFHLDPLPFHQILETINGRKTKHSEPLKLYCVMDQWRYPRLLLKAVPQRAFTNLWVLPNNEILIKEITGKFVSSKDRKMAEAYKAGTHQITTNSKDVEDSWPQVGLSWKGLLDTMQIESSSENWSIEVKSLETSNEDSRFGDSDSEESAETIDEIVYLPAESDDRISESLVSGRPGLPWRDTNQTLVDPSELTAQKAGSPEEQLAFKSGGPMLVDKTEIIPRGTQPHRRKDFVPQTTMAYEHPMVPRRTASPARDVIRSPPSSSHLLRATGPYAHLNTERSPEDPNKDSSRTQRTPNRLTADRLAPFSQNAEQKPSSDRPRHPRPVKPSSRDDTSPGNTSMARVWADPIDNAPRNGSQVKENLRRGSTSQNVSSSSIRPDPIISSRHGSPTPQGGKHDGTSELTNSSIVRRDEFVVESQRITSGARPEKRESNAHTLQSTQPHVQSGRSPPSTPVIQTRPGTPSHFGPQQVSNFQSSQPSNVPPNDLAGKATFATRGQELRSHSQKVDGRGPSELSTPKSPPLSKQSMQPGNVPSVYSRPAQPKNREDTSMVDDITSARANGASTTTHQTPPSTAEGSSSSGRNHPPAAETVNTTKNTESLVHPGTPAKEGVSIDRHTSNDRPSTPTAKPNTAAWEASVARNVAALERQGGGQEGKRTSVLPTVGSKSADNKQHAPIQRDSRPATPQPLPLPTPPAPVRRRKWYDPIVDVIWRK